MDFRFSIQTTIIFELMVSMALLIAGFITDTEVEIVWLVPSIFLIHIVIFSAPLAFAKGFDFVIYDAPADSPWKYYGFIAIAIATLLGSLMDNSVMQFIASI